MATALLAATSTDNTPHTLVRISKSRHQSTPGWCADSKHIAQTGLRHAQVAHAQQRTGTQRGARQEQRTCEDVHRTAQCAHLREVLEEVCRPGTSTCARPHDSLGLRTAFEQTSRMSELARECRERAARWAWRFERIPFCTFRGCRRGGCSSTKRHEGDGGHLDCRCCRKCSSSVCPLHCSAPRPAARSRSLTELPSAARGCRSSEEPGRAGRGVR